MLPKHSEQTSAARALSIQPSSTPEDHSHSCMSLSIKRRTFTPAWLRARRARAAASELRDANRNSATKPGRWPYADLIETRPISVDGHTVPVSQWRDDADRSLGFSLAPHFLLAADELAGFFEIARLFYCGPYPRACAAACRDFDLVPRLVESLGVSLLMVLPQNHLLDDRGQSLLALMRRQPDLRVHVYAGSAGIVDMLAGAPETSRIEFMALPLHPRDFHQMIADMYGFTVPAWFSSIR